MADFNVSFSKDDFDVTFGAQGPQGPAGVDAEAIPYSASANYPIGIIVYNESVDLFSSKVDDNLGNPLNDTDFWVPLGIAAGVVSQLDDLSDVTLNSPSNNQVLKYNGSQWVNSDDSTGLTFSTPLIETDGNVTIADSSITATQMAGNSVGTSELINGSVASAQLFSQEPPEPGQLLSYTRAGDNRFVWVDDPSDIVVDNSRLVISNLTPTSLNEGDADTGASLILEIGNPLIGETMSNELVLVVDPTGHKVPVTGSEDTSWQFTVNGDNVGRYVITCTADFTVSGTTSKHQTTGHITVQAAETDWYFATLTSSPTNIGQMTTGGEYSPGVMTTFTADGSGTRRFYIAVPTRTNGYDFYGTPNFFVEFTNTPVITGFTTDNYTLYAIDDINDNFSGTQPVYVEEA